MASTDQKTQRWIVTGRVQGVSFRWFTRQNALELGLEGFVRNLADGSVEVQVNGSEQDLAQLRARLREGPPSARVEEIREERLPGAADFKGFQIRF